MNADSPVRIESVRTDALAAPLFREYLGWMRERFSADLGIDFHDPDGAAERAYFAETDEFLGAGGRLLVAWLDDEVAGVGAFKPVDDRTVEIKRMYVRPTARGGGLARRLLSALLDEARTLGYTTARLETLSFMTAAHELYRSMGFRVTAPFHGSEAAAVGLGTATEYLELRLGRVI
jgi:GNAT superfamily N-acetyltransferase